MHNILVTELQNFPISENSHIYSDMWIVFMNNLVHCTYIKVIDIECFLSVRPISLSANLKYCLNISVIGSYLYANMNYAFH